MNKVRVPLALIVSFPCFQGTSVFFERDGEFRLVERIITHYSGNLVPQGKVKIFSEPTDLNGSCFWNWVNRCLAMNRIPPYKAMHDSVPVKLRYVFSVDFQVEISIYPSNSMALQVENLLVSALYSWVNREGANEKFSQIRSRALSVLGRVILSKLDHVRGLFWAPIEKGRKLFDTNHTVGRIETRLS